MNRPGMRVSAVGIPWYRPDSYARVRALMRDGANLPETFEKWLYRAHKAEEQIHRAGNATIRVDLDLEEFPRFCRERGLDLDTNGRTRYAAFVAARMIQANPGGQA